MVPASFQIPYGWSIRALRERTVYVTVVTSHMGVIKLSRSLYT